MPSKLPSFILRTEQETFNKIAYIAKKNERSVNKEIVFLIKQKISEYEQENGTILIEE